MHATSFENMFKCRDRYVSGAWQAAHPEPTLLDLGGADVNGSYRSVFSDPGIRYLAADLQAGPGVDIVLDDPYKIPLPDGSVDIVLSGQMLEHCEFFWLAFAEMVRVLKPDGLLLLIAPSAGPIHRYPVDCYRFYPDAFHALAKHAGVHAIDVWMDERGPWRDLVGVFSHRPRDAVRAPLPPTRHPSMRFLPDGPADGPEETCSGRGHYHETLSRLHATLAPRHYFEIGVRKGASLKLAKCPAIGVDPDPEIPEGSLAGDARLFTMSSDDFFEFAARDAVTAPPDLVFIDGMHQFEFALRDFMNIERLATPGTLVVIDDILPNHPAQAERERRTRVWTGDVWKLHRCLAEARPDLVLLPLDTFPSGLLLIAGLDPRNQALWQNYNPLVRRMNALAEVPPEVIARRDALDPADPRVDAFAATLRRLREGKAPRARVVAELREALKAPSPA